MMTNPHGDAYYPNKPFQATHITIIGVGAVGSWLTVSLAKQGCEHLTLVDFDQVTARNLGTTAFYDVDLGTHKVDALRSMLYNAVDKVKTWRVTTTNLGATMSSKTSLLIDCTDNAETRNLIHAHCPVPVLHVGINEHYGSAVWDDHFVKAVQPENEDACEVPYSLNLIMPLVGLTVDMLAHYYDTGAKRSFGFDLIAQKIINIA